MAVEQKMGTMRTQLSELDLRPHVRPGDTVAWGQASAQPLTLIEALVRQRQEVGPFRAFLGIGDRLEETLRPEHSDAIGFFGYCAAGSNRNLVQAGVMDILPMHYSDIACRMRDGNLRINVVFLRVPPPDDQGRFSLGMCRDYMVAALAAARTVIAEIDDQTPWTYGGPYLKEEDFDLLVQTTHRLPSPSPHVATSDEQAVARRVAGLVPDAATLQTGIGSLPDAVLSALCGHRDLGFHSGSLGRGVALLAQAGALTNACKRIDPGVSIGGLLQGEEELRRYAHRNPQVQLRPVDYTHDQAIIAQLDRFVAINSAVEVDLTGQVNSEVAAGRYVGAVGGAIDFVRAASRSVGGMPIIVLTSTIRSHSRIVARLSGPVTIPRSDACVIVTEHGVADLRGLTLKQRVKRMLEIADPQHREQLQREAAPLG
jgi:acyl-CoA hydrolase